MKNNYFWFFRFVLCFFDHFCGPSLVNPLQLTVFSNIRCKLWGRDQKTIQNQWKKPKNHMKVHFWAPWGPPWAPFPGKKFSRLCRENFFPPSRPWGPHGAPDLWSICLIYIEICSFSWKNRFFHKKEFFSQKKNMFLAEMLLASSYAYLSHRCSDFSI